MRPLLVALVALGCGAAAAPTVPVPVGPRAGATHALVRAAAADTLVTTVRWTLPASDGRGPLDSLTVNVTHLERGGVIHSVLPPTAVSYTVRQVIPFRDATWDVTVQVCTWRGTGANRVTCVNATSPPFVYALEAPPPVAGLVVTNVGPP